MQGSGPERNSPPGKSWTKSASHHRARRDRCYDQAFLLPPSSHLLPPPLLAPGQHRPSPSPVRLIALCTHTLSLLLSQSALEVVWTTVPAVLISLMGSLWWVASSLSGTSAGGASAGAATTTACAFSIWFASQDILLGSWSLLESFGVFWRREFKQNSSQISVKLTKTKKH